MTEAAKFTDALVCTKSSQSAVSYHILLVMQECVTKYGRSLWILLDDPGVGAQQLSEEGYCVNEFLLGTRCAR